MTYIQETEWKDNPILEIHNSEDFSDKYPFKFGISKAKMILEHISTISKFVATHTAQDDDEEKDELDELFDGLDL